MRIDPKRSLLNLILSACLLGIFGAGPSSQPSDDEGPWHRVKSFDATAKSKPANHKFLITTQKWRLTIKTESAGENPESNNIRIALMSETARDVDDKPVNWKQEMIVLSGKPGPTGSKVFDNGLDKDGKPRWFQVQVSGFQSKYEITAEDQSEDDAKPTKKKKK